MKLCSRFANVRSVAQELRAHLRHVRERTFARKRPDCGGSAVWFAQRVRSHSRIHSGASTKLIPDKL